MYKVTSSCKRKIVCFNVRLPILFCCLMALICIPFVSCASAPGAKNTASLGKMPAWVTMPSLVYPSESYFSAVGEDADRQTAEVSATHGIASLFGQNITSVTVASARMEQARKDGKVAAEQSSSINQNIQKQVNQSEVIGVEIKETWFNTAEKKWYAVAVMDKAKSASLYESMIRKNNEEIASLTADTKAETVSLETYVKYDFAAEIAGVNDTYIKRLTIINFDKGSAVRKISVTEADERAHLYKIAQQIPVTVHITDAAEDSAPSVYSASASSSFSEVISSFGFNTGSDMNERYVISGTVSFENVPVSASDLQYQRYKLDSYLTDTVTGEKLMPFAASGREGAKTAADAKTRASAALSKKIKSDFGSAFTSYLKQLSVE